MNDSTTSTPSSSGPGTGLTPEELVRYARHLNLPEVGIEGQRRLREARIALVGTGGLGSPAALYLAAAGVGTLGLIDDDLVDASNLQRQVLHRTSTIGQSKLDSAAAQLIDLNPNVSVRAHAVRLTSENALEVLRPYDIVIDGSDNFPTRYLVNDACALLHKPNVYGAIFRFDGQVSVFDADTGPCYRCLFRDPPPPGMVPSCEEGGVLGVLPGVIGSLQAMEAIKLVLGVGESLRGRLVLFDALKLQFRELTLRKDPECPLCGESPTVTSLIDYEQFCGAAPPPARTKAIGAHELAAAIDRGEDLMIVDVREPFEFDIGHIANSVLVPLHELPGRMAELDRNGSIVTVCHHGIRSMHALQFLEDAGFSGVRSLDGGIDAWARDIDPSVPRY